nr:glycosyltransferase 87 family protein [Pilimelia terevasa]
MHDRWRRLDRTAGGLPLDLALYLSGAAFAGFTAASSTLPAHRAWGALALWGYAAAALVCGGQWALRRRWPRGASAAARATLTAAAFAATCLVPLLAQAVQRAGGNAHRAQEEVAVVEAGAGRLLATGTPYLADAAIAARPAAEQLLGYLPYQPGMVVFGLPRALAGAHWWTDARVGFALVALVALGAALAVLPTTAGRRPAVVRAAQAATVLPVCALTLATGGDDLPVLALCLLACALLAGRRPGAAGAAVGAAGALKLLAWPVALVLAVAVAARRPRDLGRYLAGAVGIPLASALPAVLVDPGAAADNLVGFPLGHGVVRSPAASPLPGHLIGTHLPYGRPLALGLLLAAGLAIAWWLRRDPPRTAARAAAVCAAGLLAATLLLPATRFGYLLYPAALALWVPALRPAAGPAPRRPAVAPRRAA